ncbi:MAG: twin-arginine translocase TatA/TatE family subunit [Flavobacteriales bacterium]|jgi:sec-independent protein translocase protein TatA
MLSASPILLFLNLSSGEIFIVFLFILIFFGAESIPKIARSFGKVMYQIKNATDDIKRDIKESTDNIKKDILDQTDGSNPITEMKKELDDSVKDIKID